MYMNNFSWLSNLEHVHTSYLLLGMLAGAALTGGVLFQIGLIGWVLRGFGTIVRGSIRGGFLLWEYLLGWASWPQFLAITFVLLVAGGLAGGSFPALRILCSTVLMLMGAAACLAYMFIDLERNEVERGYKAVHNPLKGQVLARHLRQYGKQVRIPLLISATVAVIGGFALLNQGLYETVGQGWYQVADENREPIYVDFLAYSITRVMGLVDVLNLAKSHHILGAEFVRQTAWPASTLLAGFKLFFTMVLLHQIFASLRQGKLLAETIADFWSPHEPIHERARNALPVFGIVAISPLLRSLNTVSALTKEQRDQLPLILETIGPSIIPALIRHLNDPHEHVRAVVVAAIGRLHSIETIPSLVALIQDPSPFVRQSVVEALGTLGKQRVVATRKKGFLRSRRNSSGKRIGWLIPWKSRTTPSPPLNPVELAVKTLELALDDESTAVRTQAVASLGLIGPPAAAVAPRLIAMSREGDETLRCQAAQSLGEVGGEVEVTVAALIDLLQDASSSIKAAAARALGVLKNAAAPAVSSLVPLLQDGDESVRTAAAETIAQVGPLDQAATETLVEGLASPDNVVRAQTAQALGTIGAAAEEAAPALVEAMSDDNDRVRAEAVEALGKIGESAAEAAVPGLMQALQDQDNRIIALAAEALGQMGESADEAIPALVDSLSHLNPQVRRNAAEALGNLRGAAVAAQPALEAAARDEDGGVRSQAILALGVIGRPTPALTQLILSGCQDADPLVRAAAVVSMGRWNEASEASLSVLASLLEDANDQVKVEAMRALPKLAGATPAVIEGLCRRLLEDDSEQVQAHAALALGKLGPAAEAAGGPLLHAAQTGEMNVREQAMRAIALIQPPETTQAFVAGLKDASDDIRTLASAGWINAAAISEEAIPALVEALRDPAVQVRANAANALARLDAIPADAVPILIECTADADDGLRLNAAMALKLSPASAVAEVMQHLLADPNSRVRLVAASYLLSTESNDAKAGAVLVDALADPVPRVREEALDLFESLGTRGAAILEELQKFDGSNGDPESQEALDPLIEH
jgi:HEAT repeat protein